MAPHRHYAQAAEVQQRLPDLRYLPIEDGHHLGSAEQHVSVMEVAVDQRRRALSGDMPREQAAELTCPPGQLFGRPLHQPGPAHHLGL